MTLDPEPVTLAELIAAVKRHPAEARNGRDFAPTDWVLVNDDDEVIACSQSEADIKSAFYEHLDRVPAEALKLTVLQIEERGKVRVYWPTHESTLERALRATRSLNSWHGSPIDIDGFLKSRFLRGRRAEVAFDGEARIIVEVWWPEADGTKAVIGYLVEHPPDRWAFMVRHGLYLAPEAVVATVARELSEAVELDGSVICADRIRAVQRRLRQGSPRSELLDALIKLLLLTVESLHVLSPDASDTE